MDRNPKTTGSFLLEKGQVWKTPRGFIAIDHVGKRLIDYRLMSKPGQRAARSQMATVTDLTAFLEANSGRLAERA